MNGGRIKASYRLQLNDRIRIPPVRTGEQLPVQYSARTAQSLRDAIVFEDERYIVLNKPAGSAVHGGSGINSGVVEVLREGRSITKQVEVIERVDPDFRFFEMISNERNLVPRLGILALDLDNDARRLLPMEPRMQSGVIVAALAVDTSLLGEQFEPGDIVYSMNGQTLKGLKDLKEKVKAMTYGQVAVFQLERGGQLRYLMLEVE